MFKPQRTDSFLYGFLMSALWLCVLRSLDFASHACAFSFKCFFFQHIFSVRFFGFFFWSMKRNEIVNRVFCYFALSIKAIPKMNDFFFHFCCWGGEGVEVQSI